MSGNRKGCLRRIGLLSDSLMKHVGVILYRLLSVGWRFCADNERIRL